MRKDVMKHFVSHENIGLIASAINRQASLGYFFVTNIINDFHILDNARDSTSVFPLYLYDEMGKVANIDPRLSALLLAKVDNKDKIKPEDIFDYVYATLHSPSYREKYKDFLKSDFPRIPLAKDTTTFWRLVELGGRLHRLHLLDEKELGQRTTTFPQAGSNEVEQIEHKDSKVYINDTQYFDGVSREVFDFYVGGYQPAQKWLKDRKGEKFDYQDILHYQKIISSISKTIDIMQNIRI